MVTTSGVTQDWMRKQGRLPRGLMVTPSFKMKAIPKGTSNLETQLACHPHPGAASKIK